MKGQQKFVIKRKPNQQKAGRYRQIVKVLESQGMNLWDARIEARKLMRLMPKVETIKD